MTAEAMREVLLWAAATVTALTVLFRFFGTYIFAPLLDRLDDRIGERTDPLHDELREIRNEVTYNGGASLKDAMRRTERDVIRLQARFDEHFPPPHGEDG